jgi:hypothetical protein
MTRGVRATFPALVTVVAFGGMFVGSDVARAQLRRDDGGVRAVVEAFFAAAAREQWDSAAAFIDLPRFEPFLKQQVGMVRSALPPREMTVDERVAEMMANDSTMPRAVAEWEIARAKRYPVRAFGDLSYEFAGVHDSHMLLTMSVAEAAARWIEAQDSRTQIRAQLRAMGCPPDSAVEQMLGSKNIVLATIVANDSTAYAINTDGRVTRAPSDDVFGAERVMILHRRGSTWRILARRDLLRPLNSGFGFRACPTKRD